MPTSSRSPTPSSPLDVLRGHAARMIDAGRTMLFHDLPEAAQRVGESVNAAHQAQVAADRVGAQVAVRAIRKPFGGRPILADPSPNAPDYAPWREPLLPTSVGLDAKRKQISYADYNRRYPKDLDAFERKVAKEASGMGLEQMQSDPRAHAYEVFRPPAKPGAPVDNMPALPRWSGLPENGEAPPFKLPMKDGARVDVFGLPYRAGRVRIERDPRTGAYANITEPGHTFHGKDGGGYVITPADSAYPIHASGVGNWPEVNEGMGPVVFAPKHQR